jgi:hypothetical protein
MKILGKLIALTIVTVMLVGAIPIGMLAGANGPRASSRANVLTFTSAATGLPATGEYPSIGVGKFNNDNNPDIASGMLSWFAGGGTDKGLFAWVNNNGAQSWTQKSSGLDANSEFGQIAVGDINKDGFDDIVAPRETYWSGLSATGIEVFFTDGAASPTWTAAAGPTNLGGYNSVILCDVNKDNNLDIVAVTDSNTATGVKIWTGNGGTTWTPANTGLPSSAQYFSASCGDLNKDGNPDLVLGTSGTGVEVYTGNGGTSWSKATGTGLPASGTYWSTNIADFDNDGNMDIQAGLYGNGGLFVYTGNGANVYTSESSGLPVTKIYCQVSVGDIDQNGFKDLWGGVCDPTPKGFGLWMNNGNGGGALAWTQYIDAAIPSAGDYSGTAMADFNNDGVLDLVGGGAGWTAPGLGFKLWTVKVTVPSPTPNAGTDQTILVLDNATLDGSASKAPAGGTVSTYMWNMTAKPAGSTAALNDASAVKPLFNADKIGMYSFTLAVKDNSNRWGKFEAKVNVTANPWPNKKPIAKPTGPASATIYTKVQLDGSTSWDDKSITGYKWNITAKPTDSNATLSSDTIVNPTITPDYIGLFKFTLTVKDFNNTWSKDALISVNVVPAGKTPPTAKAGDDVTIELGHNATLDGRASTDDLKVIAYHWVVSSQPPGSSLAVQDLAVQNVTPQKEGIYQLSLTVKDNDNLWSQPSAMQIIVTPRNLPPIAKIDKPEDGAKFLTTDAIDFDGTKSSDPEEHDITMAWTSDKDGGLGTTSAFSKSLSAGTHVISLSVTDDHKQTTVAKVTITVKQDTNPTAIMTAKPLVILKGEKVDFDAKGSSDKEGPIAEFQFDFGDQTALSWLKAPTTSHVYKTTGSFDATVMVKDNKGLLSNVSEKVTIKVGERPNAAVKVDLPFVKVNKPVTISAADSKDNDGTIVAYYFDYGDNTNSGWVNSSSITKTYAKIGDYNVAIKVKDSDGYESTNVATVKVVVEKAAVKPNTMGGIMLPLLLVVVVVVIIVVLLVVMKMKKGKAAAQQPPAQVDLMNPPPPTTYAGQAPQQPAYDPNQQAPQQGYDPNQYQQQQTYQGYDQQGYAQQPDQSGYQYPPQQGQQ